MERVSLTRFAWLSIGVACLTIVLKTGAYLVTGSVGLLSDAVESLVNLLGGTIALVMLTVAAKPADEDHAYGHGKAEYFSSGLEGGLILVAAIAIAVQAVFRLLNPQPLAEVWHGVAISIIAAAANLVAALLLLRAGRRHNSITLEANARHLLTDVWTSAGVLIAIGLVVWTGWLWLDPVVALVVAVNIFWAGSGIIRRSIGGLMDASISTEDLNQIKKVFATYENRGVRFHALRTRQSGNRKFISVHVLVPGEWTVQRGHELLERIESDIRKQVSDAIVFTHLESVDDPASWDDEPLERA